MREQVSKKQMELHSLKNKYLVLVEKFCDELKKTIKLELTIIIQIIILVVQEKK